MPEVRIVIITFQRTAVLLRAVRSALNQTFSDIEIVVVVEKEDSASIAVLEEIADERVRYVCPPARKGPAAARDFGVDACRGAWVAFLDDDDEWLPGKLEKQLAAVGNSPNAIAMTLSKVVSPLGTVVRPVNPYENREPIDEWLFGRRSWFGTTGSFLQTSSLMIPRDVFRSLRFGEARHEEWELMIRAVKELGYRLVTVEEPLVVYYSGNTTYRWERSAAWVESVRDLLTPRAFSGFCLTVAIQGVEEADRNRACRRFLRLALTFGRPTARQLFAFLLIWLVPHSFRQKVRVGLAPKHP